jgi:hypothetical protein
LNSVDKLNMLTRVYYIVLVLLVGCSDRIDLKFRAPAAVEIIEDILPPSLTINQAVTETIGSCTFTTIVEPTNLSRFSYRVTFSEAIDVSSFTVSDITNTGTGGAQVLTWTINDCGDATNFQLVATAIEGNGTIVPEISAGAVSDPAGNSNLAFTTTDNSVDFQRVWAQEAYIKAINADAGDEFGKIVRLNGETLAVSTMLEDSNQTTITNGATANSDNTGTNSGAVYIYKRAGTTWSQEAYLKASNVLSDDLYGQFLSLNQDTLAVAAPGEDSNQTTITNGTGSSPDNSKTESGAVYIYKRTGVTWTQEAYLKAVNADSSDYFGSVTIHGNTLAVGSNRESSVQNTITNGNTASPDNSSINSGAVYVYKRNGSTWTQEAYIKAVNTSDVFSFGGSVALEEDTLVVGATGEASNLTTITNGATASNDYSAAFSGAVYVYKRTGSSWAQVAYIKAANAYQSTYFGHAVAISKDRIAVGQRAEESNQTIITNGATASTDRSNAAAGAVFVYKRTGANWVQEAYIKAANNDSLDNFGASVALGPDTLVVGAPFEDSNQTSITNGATASSDNSISKAGAVYVYKRVGSIWSQEAYIKAANSSAFDEFGTSVSISGDTIAVGAALEDSNETTITHGAAASANNGAVESGAVYVYRNNGRLFNVADIWGTSDASSITLSWHKTGGLATGYIVAFQAGATAPANCNSGTHFPVGNTNTHQELALSSSTVYSFRVCATDGYDVTEGSIFSMSTL